MRNIFPPYGATMKYRVNENEITVLQVEQKMLNGNNGIA